MIPASDRKLMLPQGEIPIIKAPVTNRTLIIPETTYLLLEECAAEDRKKEKNPVAKSMMTPKSLAQHMIKAGLEKRGYGK